MRVTKERRRHGCLPGLLILLMILLVIAMVTGFFAARSEGGREMIVDWLEKKLGMELTVENTRIGFPYLLVVEGLESVESAPDEVPLLRVEQTRIWFGFSPWLRVHVKGADLKLVVSDDDSWEPEVFKDMGDLPACDFGEISRITRKTRRKVRVSAEESSVYWATESGENKASVSGFDFFFRKVDIPKRRMYFYNLNADQIVRPDGGIENNVEAAWLASGEYDYISLAPDSCDERCSGGVKYLRGSDKKSKCKEDASLEERDRDVDQIQGRRNSG